MREQLENVTYEQSCFTFGCEGHLRSIPTVDGQFCEECEEVFV